MGAVFLYVMDCLKNWIKVKGCTDPVSESGCYINDLEGMELKNIDQVANDEQTTFQGVFDEVEKRALRRFGNYVRQAFDERYRLKTITQNTDLGREIDETNSKLPTAEYRGFVRALNDDNADWATSLFHVHYIQSISLYLQLAQNHTLKIFDLDTGTELYTKTVVPAAAGWSTVNVRQYFTARRIFVCYNATLVTGTELDVNLSGDCYGDCEAQYQGATALLASTVQTSQLTTGDNSWGLTMVGATQCRYDGLVCDTKDLWTDAILYTYGLEMVDTMLNSSRENRWTTTDARKLKDLRVLYYSKLKGVIVDRDTLAPIGPGPDYGYLNTAVDGINLEERDCCVQCNTPVKFVDAAL